VKNRCRSDKTAVLWASQQNGSRIAWALKPLNLLHWMPSRIKLTSLGKQGKVYSGTYKFQTPIWHIRPMVGEAKPGEIPDDWDTFFIRTFKLNQISRWRTISTLQNYICFWVFEALLILTKLNMSNAVLQRGCPIWQHSTMLHACRLPWQVTSRPRNWSSRPVGYDRSTSIPNRLDQSPVKLLIQARPLIQAGVYLDCSNISRRLLLEVLRYTTFDLSIDSTWLQQPTINSIDRLDFWLESFELCNLN